jgi:hypothetical protein
VTEERKNAAEEAVPPPAAPQPTLPPAMPSTPPEPPAPENEAKADPKYADPRRLGRLFAPDPRDAFFPLRAILPPLAAADVPTHKLWNVPEILDQGQTPRCVAFSTRMALEASPHRYKKGDPDPAAIYKGAQENDEWPGEGYDGTSARGAMKFLQSLGLIAAYYWPQTVDEALRYVLTSGPIMVGGNWRDGMWQTDRHGWLRPVGTVVGGHEVLLVGYHQQDEKATFVNPWGKGWGDKGFFHMKRADLIAWMADGGDMVAFAEAPYPGER